jgi:TatD DNase family protein
VIALDTHAHIKPDIGSRALDELNACVIAVTRSLGEYRTVLSRRHSRTAWAVGCHPGLPQAHEEFSKEEFQGLLDDAAVVGEVGLDKRSRVPRRLQEETFRAILAAVSEQERIISIHSAGVSATVLDLLQDHQLKGTVLHWWRAKEAETARAIEIGCYFSVNAAEATSPRILHLLPRDKVLTETDHPFGDRKERGARRPGRLDVIEDALGVLWGISKDQVRQQVWRNFRDLALATKSIDRLPQGFQVAFLSIPNAVGHPAFDK